MHFCFLKNMHEKPLEFGRMHENKKYIFFYVFEMRNCFNFFGFFLKFQRKNEYF